ncbi:MAG: hypothetical protein FRX49_13298 [Trebouxia sp. A1-2]|nr:MAG: hypothetical protein FRX49_13298 [Trebouxia sp. A1-2]
MMSRLHLGLAFCGLLLVSAAAQDPTVSLEGVQDLTPETFDKFVNGGKHALVEFYAPCYNSGRTASAFLDFINAEVKADSGFARIEDLDVLAKKYIGSAADATSSVAEEISAAVSKLTGEAQTNGEVYVSAVKKAAAKGSDYFSTELKRLERLLEGGKLSPSKLSEISRKVSVLGAFQKNDEESVHAAEE